MEYFLFLFLLATPVSGIKVGHLNRTCLLLSAVNRVSPVTKQYHAIPWNTFQYHTTPCNTKQYHTILCNTFNSIFNNNMVSLTQGMAGARSLNCYHPPVSLVGRFRLGGQVLLGIENLSLAPRWAETISTTKALVTQ